jgi:sec-independent protein translocase protein TatC
MSQNGEMSFLQHLEALRWHLIRSTVAIVVVSVLAFIYKDILFDDIILAPGNAEFWTNQMMCKLAQMIDMPALCINQRVLEFQNISMAGQFTTHMWVAFLAGIVVAFPYIFWEFWSFVKPALNEKEVRHTHGAIFVVSFLFLLGILFGYYIVAPMSIDFLMGYQVSDSVKNIVTLDSYISTVTSIVFSGGVMFELPVVIFFFAKIGLVTSGFLRKYRRHAYVVIVVVAAIITPPDWVSCIMVSLPLVLLYEVSISVAKRIETNRKSV